MADIEDQEKWKLYRSLYRRLMKAELEAKERKETVREMIEIEEIIASKLGETILDKGGNILNARARGVQLPIPAKLGYQIHHLIPYNLVDHPIWKEADMNINETENLIYLPDKAASQLIRDNNLAVHEGSHAQHIKNDMEIYLAKLFSVGKQQKWSSAQFKQALLQVIEKEKKLCTENKDRLNVTHKKEHEKLFSFKEKFRNNLLSLVLTTALGVKGAGLASKPIEPLPHPFLDTTLHRMVYRAQQINNNTNFNVPMLKQTLIQKTNPLTATTTSIRPVPAERYVPPHKPIVNTNKETSIITDPKPHRAKLTNNYTPPKPAIDIPKMSTFDIKPKTHTESEVPKVAPIIKEKPTSFTPQYQNHMKSNHVSSKPKTESVAKSETSDLKTKVFKPQSNHISKIETVSRPKTMNSNQYVATTKVNLTATSSLVNKQNNQDAQRTQQARDNARQIRQQQLQLQRERMRQQLQLQRAEARQLQQLQRERARQLQLQARERMRLQQQQQRELVRRQQQQQREQLRLQQREQARLLQQQRIQAMRAQQAQLVRAQQQRLAQQRAAQAYLINKNRK